MVYARKYPHPELHHLNAVRLGAVLADAKRRWEKSTPQMAADLVAEVAALKVAFDAIVLVPSSRTDGLPFFDALSKSFPVTDLSSRFSTTTSIKAARGASLQAMVGRLVYSPKGDEQSLRHLLVVDDSIASGVSVAAILRHLWSAGVPADCAVVVAVAASFRQP